MQCIAGLTQTCATVSLFRNVLGCHRSKHCPLSVVWGSLDSHYRIFVCLARSSLFVYVCKWHYCQLPTHSCCLVWAMTHNTQMHAHKYTPHTNTTFRALQLILIKFILSLQMWWQRHLKVDYVWSAQFHSDNCASDESYHFFYHVCLKALDARHALLTYSMRKRREKRGSQS